LCVKGLWVTPRADHGLFSKGKRRRGSAKRKFRTLSGTGLEKSPAEALPGKKKKGKRNVTGEPCGKRDAKNVSGKKPKRKSERRKEKKTWKRTGLAKTSIH